MSWWCDFFLFVCVWRPPPGVWRLEEFCTANPHSHKRLFGLSGISPPDPPQLAFWQGPSSFPRLPIHATLGQLQPHRNIARMASRVGKAKMKAAWKGIAWESENVFIMNIYERCTYLYYKSFMIWGLYTLTGSMRKDDNLSVVWRKCKVGAARAGARGRQLKMTKSH